MRASAGSTTTAVAAALLGAGAIAFIAVLALQPTAAQTAPTVSAQSGPLLIEGKPSGNHVRIRMSANGKRFSIQGNVRGSGPHRCKKRHHGTLLRCPARGVTAVVVDLGGAGDRLEILESLPVPVTGRMGPGSDKMIGAGESDFCYPGGARRNRCIGGGGDDVCITGPRNSDCVGGPGNDYCEASTGSDGCWGGPGRDICKMGPGHDGCHGEGGNDHLFGGSSSDKLYGGAGNDYCDGGRGVGRSYTCERGPRH
ncbi:MAG: hypothetical protein AABM29_08050 [Actinomycetota bacterium]